MSEAECGKAAIPVPLEWVKTVGWNSVDTLIIRFNCCDSSRDRLFHL